MPSDSSLQGLLATGGGMAEKPEWAGGAKPGKPEQSGKQARPGQPKQGKAQGATVQVGGYFGDTKRTVLRNYYSEQFSVGRCPPGLAVQLGVPPAGHRYVRVGADILLIAVGTAMVIDALQDLNRM